MRNILSMMLVLLSTFIFAQTNVTGLVIDSNNTPIPGANVVFDATTGAVSDFNGEFSIDVDAKPPFSLTVSSIGFETTSITVSASDASVIITLSDSENLLDEVILSASKTAQSLFESPVTVERFDYTDIAASTGADFYQSLEQLKGVQVITTGIINQTVNARGFSTAWNEGFVQLVDGMNNEAPGLNFSAGNLAGVSELDLYNVEFLPGASSALHGPNAYKGILIMNTKNPFDFQGFSAYLTQGVTSQDVAGDNHYYDFGMRFAHAFNDKFAVKATLGYVKGQDWVAADYSDANNTSANIYVPGTLEDANPSLFPTYDGRNVYGEQQTNWNLTNVFLGPVLPALAADAGLGPASVALVSRYFEIFAPNYFGQQEIMTTGYNEMALDPRGAASNFKFNVAAHYRFNGNSELSYVFNNGRGNTLLQGFARFKMVNFGIQQHKLEYKTKNFTARAYKSIESSGNTMQFEALGGYLFFAQPGGPVAFGANYFGTYFQNLVGQIHPDPVTGINAILSGILFGGDTSMYDRYVTPKMNYLAHGAARQAANANMLVPGSPEFNEAYDRIAKTPIADGGAVVLDNTLSNSYEATYDLSDLVTGFEMVIGGSHREYVLRSNGTLFTDYDGPITTSETGLFASVQRDIFDGAISLNGALRYDKAQNYDGSFTPRLGALINLAPRHNLRISYQTAMRTPTMQDMYIGLRSGTQSGFPIVLFGSSPDSVDRFTTDFINGVTGASYTVTGDMVMNNSYRLEQFLAGSFEVAELDNVEPEYVQSREIGYRYNGKKFSLDVNAYWANYRNFIASKNVAVPFYGSVANGSALAAVQARDVAIFAVDNNTDELVSTMGLDIGLDAKIFEKFDFGAKFAYNEMDRSNIDPNYETSFNTPKVRGRLSLGSTEIGKNFGFNLSASYHNAFLYESSFADGIIPANWVFNASMSFDVPELQSKVKIGAVNLTGDDYVSIPYTGLIGSQYYVKFILNP
jgi:outer membrane receptor protein involved in Fe transport